MTDVDLLGACCAALTFAALVATFLANHYRIGRDRARDHAETADAALICEKREVRFQTEKAEHLRTKARRLEIQTQGLDRQLEIACADRDAAEDARYKLFMRFAGGGKPSPAERKLWGQIMRAKQLKRKVAA